VIKHVAVESHESHALAKTYLTNGIYPSVFTFELPIPKKKSLQVMESCPFIEHKTSFGAKKSRTDPFPTATTNGTICRLSVGYDDSLEVLLKGFDYLLKNSTK